jgi:hypothetical protein
VLAGALLLEPCHHPVSHASILFHFGYVRDSVSQNVLPRLA